MTELATGDRDPLEFKRKHLRPLEKRVDNLKLSLSMTSKSNGWRRAELSALERALHELRDMLDYRNEEEL